MFRHLSPDINLELPHVCTGVFTQTSWAAHSRHVRFISKVMLAILDRMSGEWVLWQMVAVLAIAVTNLLVNLILPPLLAPQLKWGIIVVQASLTTASGVALFAMSSLASDTPPAVSAVVYMVAVILPFFIYALGVPGFSALCHCTRTRIAGDAHRAVAPDVVHVGSQELGHEVIVPRAEQVDTQPRLAWGRSSSD
mmetsp:Transcript_110655/g.293935  ORF Transcript_110655/g.293935 Transcript_110655/m.293935 type:complete len:195 (-) Transcript_110655:176-760(-)